MTLMYRTIWPESATCDSKLPGKNFPGDMVIPGASSTPDLASIKALEQLGFQFESELHDDPTEVRPKRRHDLRPAYSEIDEDAVLIQPQNASRSLGSNPCTTYLLLLVRIFPFAATETLLERLYAS
jgi:hypothetical protein